MGRGANIKSREWESAAECVAYRIQNVEEVARRDDLAHQGHPRQRLHLGVRDVMQAAEARIFAKFLPSRLLVKSFFGSQKLERPGVGEEEESPQVESETLREPAQNFIRRMAFAGFEV